MRFKTSLVLAFALAIACGASAYAADPPTKSPDQPSDQERLQAAHERLEQAAREVAELSTKMATVGVPNALTILSHNPNRAMLGIGMGGSRDSDTEGVVVASVSPGGPAAGAGLKAGDVIVELNGKALKRDKDDSSREKLVKEMSKLSPGDEVSLRYTREGKALTTKLKVDRLPQELARREMRMRVLPGERRHGDD